MCVSAQLVVLLAASALGGIDDCLCEFGECSAFPDGTDKADFKGACQDYAISDVGMGVAPWSGVMALTVIALLLWRCCRCCNVCGGSKPQDGCCCGEKRWNWRTSEGKRNCARWGLVVLGLLACVLGVALGFVHNRQITDDGIGGAFELVDGKLADVVGVATELRDALVAVREALAKDGDAPSLGVTDVESALDDIEKQRQDIASFYTVVETYDGYRYFALLGTVGALALVLLGVAVAGFFRAGTCWSVWLFFVVVIFTFVLLIQHPAYHAVATVLGDVCGEPMARVQERLGTLRTDLGCVDRNDPAACDESKPLCSVVKAYRDVKNDDLKDVVDAVCDALTRNPSSCAPAMCGDVAAGLAADQLGEGLLEFMQALETDTCRAALTCPPTICSDDEVTHLEWAKDGLAPAIPLMEIVQRSVLPYLHCEPLDPIPGEIDDVVCGGLEAGFAGVVRVMIGLWVFVSAALLLLPLAAKWNDAARGKWDVEECPESTVLLPVNEDGTYAEVEELSPNESSQPELLEGECQLPMPLTPTPEPIGVQESTQTRGDAERMSKHFTIIWKEEMDQMKKASRRIEL